jgi:hypothetical protein
MCQRWEQTGLGNPLLLFFLLGFPQSLQHLVSRFTFLVLLDKKTLEFPTRALLTTVLLLIPRLNAMEKGNSLV